MNTEQEAPQTLSADYREWSDTVLEAMRDYHANPKLRLWAAEELSQRAAVRNLSLADAQAALDAKEAAALAEYGPEGERLQRRLRRRQAADFNKRMTPRAESFCRLVNEGVHHYREAGEALKDYLNKKITCEKLAEIINAHLILPVCREACDALTRYARREITLQELTGIMHA